MEENCTLCGNPLKINAKFCTNCGAKVVAGANAIPNTPENICECGAELKSGVKFCTTCGKKVQPVVESTVRKENTCDCGAEYKVGAKFCTSCGKSLVKPIVAEEKVKTEIPKPVVSPVIPTPEPKEEVRPTIIEHPAAAPRKKKRIFVKVVAAVLILGALGVGGWYGYNEFFGGVRKKLLIESQIVPSDKDQTVKYEDEIAVTVPWGLIESEQTLSIYSVKGLPEEEGLSMLGAYDITMSNTTQFDGFLEITFTYNPADLPAGINPERDLFCMYLDESNNTWKSMPYSIDASKNQITVYSNHLTTFAPWAVSEKVEPSPMMKVAHVKFPGGSFMSSDEVVSTMESFAAVSPGSDGAVKAGWGKVNEWFGITAAAGSFAENALEMGALKGINEVATEVGLGFALVQCAIDIADGKTDKATLELSKNLYNYWALKLINTSAINLAFVGVFVIDWSLNKFINAAISGRTDIYQKAYDLYYQEKRKNEKINGPWWYKKLKKTMKSVKNPEDASVAMQKVIHDYVWEFWGNESTVAAYIDRVTTGTGFTGGGFLSEKLKKDISDEQYASIIKTLNETNVFERIVKELRLEMQGKLYDKLCLIQAELNKVNHIKIVAKVDPECEDYADISVSGLDVSFNISNTAHGKQWTGTTDKNGEMEFNCTTLGFLDAGSPGQVDITIDGPEGEEEVFSGDLKLAGNGKTTLVEITIGSPKLEGTWKLDATCTFANLDASLQYMDGMADLYGSGDEYRETRSEVTNSMVGKKAEMPDLVMDGMEYIWKVTKENGYIVITSPGFDDTKGLGGTQYKIKFNGRKQFTGTMETHSFLGDKSNVMKFDVVGTRIK
jgi:hypothetical protein